MHIMNGGGMDSFKPGSEMEDEKRQSKILGWINDNLVQDPNWINEDRYMEVEGGDIAFFTKMQEMVEKREEGMSFYFVSIGGGKWKIGVVKKHEAV